MKTWKLVSGILSIVFSVMVVFQSMAAGAYNALENTGEISGTAGLLVAAMMLTGGIVSIVTRGGSRGGSIALIILFGLGALIGVTLAGSFSDLVIWGSWCALCAGISLIHILKEKRRTRKKE